MSHSRFRFCVNCAAAFVMLAAAANAQDINPPPFDMALLDRALSRMELRADELRVAAHDLHYFEPRANPSPLAALLFAQPLEAPLLPGPIRSAARIQTTRDCVELLALLSRWQGTVVRRGLVGDPLERARELAGGEAALRAAVERLFNLGDSAPSANLPADLDAQLASVPPPLQQSLAVLLHVTRDAHDWVRGVRGQRAGDDWSALVRDLTQSEAQDDRPTTTLLEDHQTMQRLASAVAGHDPRPLLIAAEELTFAIHEFVNAAELLRATPDGRAQVEACRLVLETPLGLISIGADHALDPQAAPLLLIDTARDDEYANVAYVTPGALPLVSIAIDLDGNDRYLAPGEVGGPATAHAGVAILVDLGGNDEYRVSRAGMAHALFGASLLYDADGDDRYVATEQGIAYAVAGVAALVDGAGHDIYELYSSGQGYGGPLGAAALVDLAGDDRYLANDSDIRFPSPQSAEHNVSMAQGAGNGWRGDYLHGISVPGGVGLLYDDSGDDTYTCGVFGQGVGYWFGTGLLIDCRGNDTYTGQWYAQGASAHFAVGVLIDESGDDRYDAILNMSHGAGHDVGVGVLADLRGNDDYRVGSLALGAGNAGGVGIFLEGGGDDEYILGRPSAENFGWTSPSRSADIRALMPGAGVFIDLGGADAYPDDRGGNERRWEQPDRGGPSPGIGKGYDRAGE